MARSLVTWVGLALTLTPTLALILTPRLTPRLVLVGVRSTTASSTTALTTPTTLTSTRAASPASSASLPVHGVDITPVLVESIVHGRWFSCYPICWWLRCR